jgi:hypothetical protein
MPGSTGAGTLTAGVGGTRPGPVDHHGWSSARLVMRMRWPFPVAWKFRFPNRISNPAGRGYELLMEYLWPLYSMRITIVMVVGKQIFSTRPPTWHTNCRGSLLPAVNFYRSRVGLGWLAQETTGFILVWASEE